MYEYIWFLKNTIPAIYAFYRHEQSKICRLGHSLERNTSQPSTVQTILAENPLISLARQLKFIYFRTFVYAVFPSHDLRSHSISSCRSPFFSYTYPPTTRLTTNSHSEVLTYTCSLCRKTCLVILCIPPSHVSPISMMLLVILEICTSFKFSGRASKDMVLRFSSRLSYKSFKFNQMNYVA